MISWKKNELVLIEGKVYRKIGGGLFVIPVLFLLLPIYLLAQFKRDILPNVKALGLYLQLNPAMILVAIFEVVSIITLFYLLISSIIFFFKKKVKFQKVMVSLLGFYSLFLIVDYFLCNLFANYATPEIVETFNAPYRKVIYRSLIISAILIPYLLVSKRVKGTFIK
ncbi:hypothetical protein AMS62_20360 [Bacillus sp. FJAT-18019]|nr:hypothetical protein AMS62_20360 [Bacillus sp. FJAT-18019]